MAIFETKKPGRIPDGVTPVLINGTTVLDFDFDPFDNSRIAASCDDGTIRIWIIPEEGLTRPGMHFRFNRKSAVALLVRFCPFICKISKVFER